MKQFRPSVYKDPIDINRYPSLAPLDDDLRREALGLPVKRSAEDKQFLSEMETWLATENKRLESKRILKGLQTEKRIALADRLLPNKMIPSHLQHEYMQYKAEQRRNEQKWLARRERYER